MNGKVMISVMLTGFLMEIMMQRIPIIQICFNFGVDRLKIHLKQLPFVEYNVY